MAWMANDAFISTQYAFGLCLCGAVVQHIVEYLCRLARGVSSVQLFAARYGETYVGRFADGLVAVGHHLEFVGEGYFVVSVKVVHHGETYSETLQGVVLV